MPTHRGYTPIKHVNIYQSASRSIRRRKPSTAALLLGLIWTGGDFMVDYDYLVVALGVTVNTFNTPGVMEHCHFLKVVEDAQKIRKSVIDCFEKASLPNLSEEEKRKILHFVIIGGGPTGVEFAVELHDFLVEDLVKLYPAIEEFVKITIMQSG